MTKINITNSVIFFTDSIVMSHIDDVEDDVADNIVMMWMAMMMSWLLTWQ